MDPQSTSSPQSSEPEAVLPEVQVDDAAQSNAPVSAPPIGIQPVDQAVLQQGQGASTPQSQQTPVSAPLDAADVELIEKEWVIKAKQIIEQTGEDPYTQQRELSKIRADYIKKRYNKDLSA